MVHVAAPVIRAEGDHCVVEAGVSVAGSTHTLWYRLPREHRPAEDTLGDALFAATLILAMATDRHLRIDAPVSHLLAAQAETIQDIFTLWFPQRLERTRIETQLPAEPSKTAGGGGSLSCFTGGVDSFYSLEKNRESITSLLFVHGFDIPLSEEAFRRETSERLRRAARAAGLELIEVETNLRELLDPALSWGGMSQGAALASVALLLTGNHSTLIVPASHSYADLLPRGSHVVLDHLWSTERLRIVHDGAEASRTAKTRSLLSNESAQQHLRVCWQMKGAYNCGECEKCLRTQITLDLLGALDDFRVFDATLTPERLRRLRVKNHVQLTYARENLELAEQIDPASVAARALRRGIRRYQFARAGRLFADGAARTFTRARRSGGSSEEGR